MEQLTAWANALPVEFPKLWQCLKSNAYPSSFLTNVLKLRPETFARLPQVLIFFLALYLGCGTVTLILRYAKHQKPLSSVHHQVNMSVLVFLEALLLPPFLFLERVCWRDLRGVAPFRGNGDYVRFFGEVSVLLLYMLMAVVVVLFTAWPPLTTFLRYLREYRLRGVPHAVFEVGFGLCLLSVVLLSAFYGDWRLYLLLVPVLVLLGILQAGGHVPGGAPKKEPKAHSGRKTS